MHCGVEVTESSTNKQHHPLHNICVYIYINILDLRTHVRAQGLGHGVCAAGVGFRDQGSIRLGL